MLNIGWVDFSKSDRDMVLSVLRQLTEPGAVDELGIGTIRDGFADILFPGTSTIQTRAKYLFIIPYICKELERGARLLPRDFVATLEQNELDLIDKLAVEGAEVGVIGQRSRQSLRRKPSSIYWSALRTFGMFAEKMTVAEYAGQVYRQKTVADNQKTGGKRTARYEDDTVDDIDTGMRDGVFWRVLEAEEDWRDSLAIDLTKEEANYLREKIISAEASQNSLLALVLKEDRREFTQFSALEDIDGLRGIMPQELWSDYRLARDFSRFVHGAQIRYNVLYSEGKNEAANTLWEDYTKSRPSVDLSEIQARLKPNPKVMKFLKSYQSALGKEKELDELIVSRERDIKGPSRAKLTNRELYGYKENSVNMGPLTYRMFNAQRIVRDIFEGVDRDA